MAERKRISDLPAATTPVNVSQTVVELEQGELASGSRSTKMTMEELADAINPTPTKILWTGPLSVAGLETGLNVGERFSDWDLIIVSASTDSDTDLTASITNTRAMITPVSYHKFTNATADIVFRYQSDTTFSILTKNVAAGNIQMIIGVKL